MKLFTLSLFAGLFLSCRVFAAEIKIQWDPNPEIEQVTKYCIYISNNGVYTLLREVPAREAGSPVLVDIGQGGIKLVVTAKNALGLESLPSDELYIPGVPSRPKGLTVPTQILLQ